MQTHASGLRRSRPMGSAMRSKPPDLTGLTRRNGDLFPRALVFKIIDGRQRLAGHGGPDMPVWGGVFRREAGAWDEAAIEARVQALVDHLERLQTRIGQ
jgi:hypothetical protein